MQVRCMQMKMVLPPLVCRHYSLKMIIALGMGYNNSRPMKKRKFMGDNVSPQLTDREPARQTRSSLSSASAQHSPLREMPLSGMCNTKCTVKVHGWEAHLIANGTLFEVADQFMDGWELGIGSCQWMDGWVKWHENPVLT